MPRQRITILAIFFTDIKGEQILLHQMSIVLQVDRYHNISPNARVREIGIGLTTAPSTSQ